MSGAGSTFAPATISVGSGMSCGSNRVSSEGRRSSRIRSLMSPAYARSRCRVISTVPVVGVQMRQEDSAQASQRLAALEGRESCTPVLLADTLTAVHQVDVPVYDDG